MDFMSKCEVCGKEYDSYMRTFFVQNSNDESSKKCCCRECLNKEAAKKPHRYTNHIPSFCDGGDLIIRLFDTKEELIEWLKDNLNYSKDTEELCCSEDGSIITVKKTEKYWWVHGFSTLEKYDLPYWREVVIKLYGNI